MLRSNVRPINSEWIESEHEIELSVVIPCLNESQTVGQCVRRAIEALDHAGIAGEVVVGDNGSSDNSREIAAAAGARVVIAEQKGYGSALLAGIGAAKGRYILMGDADCSYDFGELPKFVAKLRNGAALVQGCRLPAGGGKVRPGAMPFLHRWVGNPFFSMIARWFFRAPIHDVNCGMRAFTAEHFKRLDQRCSGMEFAVEMVLKSALMQVPIAEVPITLHPDARVNMRPHLRTFRDGWRTLRFFLICSPLWLFLIPGALLMVLGVIGYGVALPGLRLHGIGFDVNTLLVATMAIVVGFQAIFFSIAAKQFAVNEGLLPDDPRFKAWLKSFTLERGLIAGAILTLLGLAGVVSVTLLWWHSAWGALDSAFTLRILLPSALALTLGVQTIFSSFFLGMLGMQRRRK